MKKVLFFAMLAIQLNVQAQKLHLLSGEFTPIENGSEIKTISNWTNAQFQNNIYCIIQFSNSASQADRKGLTSELGIQFFDYIPRWAFIASVPSNIDASKLAKYHVRSILPYEGTYKIHPKLNDRPFPAHILKENGQLELQVEIHHNIDKQSIPALCAKNNLNFIKWENDFYAVVQMNETQIQTAASLPWVKYIQAIASPTVVENLTERTNHRINMVDAEFATGLHYDGTGINVAVGDDGFIGPHIDFKNRLTHHPTNLNNGGSHADHVCGIVAGGGNFNPVTSGNGRGADLHVYSYYGNITSANTDYNIYGIRILSNSLGQGCNDGYTSDAQSIDQLLNSKRYLSSVHSAGNSGQSTSCGIGSGFFTITGGYKAGKNVITVGNVDNDDVIAPSSSRGPTADGRIKPEVVATGTNVYSTQPDNTYTNLTGTSMSCPGVAGTIASLMQEYKENNGGTNPVSFLTKAILMNTADDLGNPGPDFTYGYGRVNARKASDAILNVQYFVDSVQNGDVKAFNFTVPANMTHIKAMLYWPDVQGTPGNSVQLVNNLDMRLEDVDGTPYYPWVLDNSANAVALNTPAVQGIDSINNVEQVTLDSTQTGLHTVYVTGTDIPSGFQKFAVVYEYMSDSLHLTYPNGGEHFAAGVTERIRWDAYNNNLGKFNLRYSSNGGATYTTIALNIAADKRFYDWTPPAGLNTGQMLIRISRNGLRDVSDTLFSIMDIPQNVRIDTACNNQFYITWDTVAGADGYKVYMLGNKYMDEIMSVPTNYAYINAGVNMTDTFYFAVAATNSTNGAVGRRTLAYVKLPGDMNCNDDAYNIETILPQENNTYSCASSATASISVKIKNIGLETLSNFPISYQINAQPVVNEIVPGPIVLGDTAIYTFATTADLSVAGNYTITSWVRPWKDVIYSNDTSVKSITVVSPTTLLPPVVEEFEGNVFPPIGWRVIDADTNVKWQKTLCFSGAYGGNTHAAYMDNYNYTNLQQVDDLETPEIDLTAVTTDSVIATFDVAHAYGPVENDTLKVLVSEDCAATYDTTSYTKWGANLATVGMMNTIYSPTQMNQWRNEHIDLTSYIGKKIFLRFRGINLHGNNVYVDNVNIIMKNLTPLGFGTFENNNGVNVYPNPSDGNYVLEINSNKDELLTYSVYSVAGQKLKESRVAVSSGTIKVALNITNLASGIYFLEVRGKSNVQKIKLSKN